MGGRGSHVSSPSQPRRNVDALIEQMRRSELSNGDYDANGKLTEWQQMESDAAAHQLHVIDNMDTSQYNDGHDFYDAPYQKFVLNYDLNDMPTVLNDADFDKYVQATGQEAMVRGYSSKESRDRVMSDLFHTGTGYYGDGIYFGPERGGYANDYGGGDPNRIIHVALSPNARVIDYRTLRNSMPSSAARRYGGTQLGKALYKAGQNGNMSNDGESQWALKNGYNVIRISAGQSNERYVALTRDALVIKKF